MNAKNFINAIRVETEDKNPLQTIKRTSIQTTSIKIKVYLRIGK